MYYEFWTASLVLFLAGALLAVAGQCLLYYGAQQETYKDHTEARVVDIVARPRIGEEMRSEFRNRQVAVFEFYAGGKPVKVTDPTVTYPCRYYMNQRVRICYDREHPEHFQVSRENSWQKAGRYLGMVSILFLLAGCVCFLVYAARKN